MRKSSVYMLALAVVLGLLAVFVARFFLLPQTPQQLPQTAEAQSVSVVAAAQPLAFGDKITPDKLKIVQLPAAGVPAGSFQRIPDATGNNDKLAMRAIEVNEILTGKAISSQGSRLSTSPLLGATMRAVSLPINEAAGAGGFLVAGDRVDVFVTHAASGTDLPYTDLLVQDARVLAVGQDSNVSKEKPEVVRTATIEVTPIQAQKVTLAQQVGTLSVTLRSATDDVPVKLKTVRPFDLLDGKKPTGNGPVQASAGPRKPVLPTVDIVRGTTATTYTIPRAR